jgi:hypothetical protein
MGVLTSDPLNKIITEPHVLNTTKDLIARSAGYRIKLDFDLVGNNQTVVTNIFQVQGTILILTADGLVVDNTTLNNCTNIYWDVWDGTNSDPITKVTGANLNGAPVGTFFIKDEGVASAVTVLQADEGRIYEPSAGKKAHQEFFITQKAGVDTFIRFHYTTTDTPINGKLAFYMTWLPINNGNLTKVI